MVSKATEHKYEVLVTPPDPDLMLLGWQVIPPIGLQSLLVEMGCKRSIEIWVGA